MEERIQQAIFWDVKYFADPIRVLQSNPELFGNQLSRLARLALIAEDLSDEDKKTKCIDAIKRMITPWLTGTNSNKLLYDTTWGGLITSDSLKG